MNAAAELFSRIKKVGPLFAFLLLQISLVQVSLVNADEQDTTQGITITGDKEMPQVLYIIPWKSVLTIAAPEIELLEVRVEMLSACDIATEFKNSLFSLLDCTVQKPYNQLDWGSLPN